MRHNKQKEKWEGEIMWLNKKETTKGKKVRKEE